MNLDGLDSRAIVKHGEIKKSHLNQNQYTISLLQKALSVELINRQQFYGIQVEIMNILKDLILRYTKEESSSVTTDTAEGILNSVLYAIDMYLIRFDNPEDAIADLKALSVKEIYEKGVRLVSQCFEETKKLFNKVYRERLDIKLDAYNATLQDAIPAFLNKYGIIFEAHNTMASIDYPLAINIDDRSIRGVLFIKKYLEYINIENQFCNYFSKEDIEKILRIFGRNIKMEYRIELINIFELVFNNSAFSTLAGKSSRNLAINKYDYQLISEQLTRLNSSMINLLINDTVKKMIAALNISNPDMLDYIDKYKDIFIKRVINAVNNDSLSSIIVTEKEEEQSGSIILFKEGERMSDADFKALVKKLTGLSKTVDKINLIKTEIKSLHDFVDILNSDCLFGDEFEELFNSMGDMELAILAKMVFYEELRGSLPDLALFISQKTVVEADWQEAFVSFIKNMDEARTKLIENYLREVDYEEISFY